ncbi:MAG: ATP-binding cassette domain-containing protein [Spirochaetaceae bacterium]|nr:ATP-binding cassette domain-containing protein [Spirochaetaceae bacterium]
MIEVKGVCKIFPGAKKNALNEVDFTLEDGAVHVVLGENGAGKSTLMHILAGFIQASSGTVSCNGGNKKKLTSLSARRLNIGMVSQRPSFCAGFKVWEDAFLGCGGFFYSASRARKMFAAHIDESGLTVPLDAFTEELSDGERHKAAVLRLLLRGSRRLVFDEPSAVLNEQESALFASLLKRLAVRGYAIALITHKIEEALDLASRITVMREGRVVESRNVLDWSRKELLQAMFPNPAVLSAIDGEASFASVAGGEAGEPEAPKMEVENLCSFKKNAPLRGVSFKAYPGRTLGIFGLKADGLEALETAVCGFGIAGGAAVDFHGKITIENREITDCFSFRRNGGAFLASGGRRAQDYEIAGCARNLSIYDNLIVHKFASKKETRFFYNFWTASPQTVAFASAIKEKAKIKALLRSPLGTLSGGMIQRLMLERELEGASSVLVVSQALWGLDIKQRGVLIKKIHAAAARGLCVILFSTNEEELTPVCDRILRLKSGFLLERR